MKKLICILTTLSLCLSFTACGTNSSDTADTQSSSAETSAAEDASEDESSDEASDESSEESSDEASDESSEEASDETDGGDLAAAQACFEAYQTAVADKDFDALLKCYDLDILMMMDSWENTETDEPQQFTEDDLREMYQNGEITDEDVFGTGEVLTYGELEDGNELIPAFEGLLSEMGAADDISIDKCFLSTVSSSGSVEVEPADGVEVEVDDDSSFSMGMPIAVIHVNGEWKVDSALTLMAAFYSAFADMGEDDDDFSLDDFDEDDDIDADADEEE